MFAKEEKKVEPIVEVGGKFALPSFMFGDVDVNQSLNYLNEGAKHKIDIKDILKSEQFEGWDMFFVEDIDLATNSKGEAVKRENRAMSTGGESFMDKVNATEDFDEEQETVKEKNISENYHIEGEKIDINPHIKSFTKKSGNNGDGGSVEGGYQNNPYNAQNNPNGFQNQNGAPNGYQNQNSAPNGGFQANPFGGQNMFSNGYGQRPNAIEIPITINPVISVEPVIKQNPYGYGQNDYGYGNSQPYSQFGSPYNGTFGDYRNGSIPDYSRPDGYLNRFNNPSGNNQGGYSYGQNGYPQQYLPYGQNGNGANGNPFNRPASDFGYAQNPQNGQNNSYGQPDYNGFGQTYNNGYNQQPINGNFGGQYPNGQNGYESNYGNASNPFANNNRNANGEIWKEDGTVYVAVPVNDLPEDLSDEEKARLLAERIVQSASSVGNKSFTRNEDGETVIILGGDEQVGRINGDKAQSERESDNRNGNVYAQASSSSNAKSSDRDDTPDVGQGKAYTSENLRAAKATESATSNTSQVDMPMQNNALDGAASAAQTARTSPAADSVEPNTKSASGKTNNVSSTSNNKNNASVDKDYKDLFNEPKSERAAESNRTNDREAKGAQQGDRATSKNNRTYDLFDDDDNGLDSRSGVNGSEEIESFTLEKEDIDESYGDGGLVPFAPPKARGIEKVKNFIGGLLGRNKRADADDVINDSSYSNLISVYDYVYGKK